MKLSLRVAGAVVALVLVATGAAQAGWVVVEADGTESFISKGRMRGSWDTGISILDANTSTITMFDDMRRIYATGTVDELCTEIKNFMESMMSDMPPEQREMVQRMMGHDKAPEVKIVDKGAGEKISGFDTKRYDVLADGELYEQLWIADDGDLVAECKPVMVMLARFSQCMASANPMGGASDPEATPEYAGILEMGVIVRSVSAGELEEGIAPEEMSIQKRDVPESTFKGPDGYRAVSFAEAMGMTDGDD
jgi:hypothetical protein